MEKWEASKKLKKPDGTIAIVWEGKLHNWDGPALIPQGKRKKGDKNQSMKSKLSDYRN